MLDVINSLSHGYVAIPIINALEHRGVFTILDHDGPLPIDELTTRCRANEGHLRVALRMFQGLGWSSIRNGCVELTAQAEQREFIPSDIAAIYAAPPTENAAHKSVQQLAAYLGQSIAGWGDATRRTATLLEGAVVLPMLHVLHGSCGADVSALQRFPAPVRQELTKLLTARGWAKMYGPDPQLTDAGKFLFNRISSAGTVLSYRPMLVRIDEVIFSNCQNVFARDEEGNECHLDRTLNVVSSGFQHEQFFAEVVELILDLFADTPLGEQPAYIMDTGCGDGSLLRAIYRAIVKRTPRGRALEQFPLTLIAVDLNEDARKAAACTFGDIPHMVLAGDVSDPAAIIQDARAHGVEHPDQILHIRSFLDHERAFSPPSGQYVTSRHSEAVSVARDGSWIRPDISNSSLVEYLQKWASVIGKHGLVALEVHCLKPNRAGQYFDEAESIFFDAYHGFSGQHLVEPEVYLLAAASAGLFPRQSRRFPRHFPFTRITLHHFDRREIEVRRARKSDLDAACDINRACWPKHLQTPPPVLEQRICSNPHEQFFASIGGQIVGILYTQRIDPEALRTARWRTVDAIKDEAGSALQLLGIAVLPAYRPNDVGTCLLQLALEWARCCDGVESVVGVSQCSEFQLHQPGPPSKDDLQAYCRSLNGDGQPVDPTLRFHTSNGAQIVGVVEDYNPADTNNGGFGIMIKYNLQKTEGSGKGQMSQLQSQDFSEPVEAATEDRNRVLDILNSVHPQRVTDTSQPFMEMGLTSVELLAVRARLAKQFNCTLESAFLFRYNTVDSVTSALRAMRKRLPKSALPVMTHPISGRAGDDRIAVVGLPCRLPCGNAEAFWRLLLDGRESIGPLPADRRKRLMGHNGYSANDWGSYLDGIDKFDAQHFRISPVEARLMDPQQRILLELTWELFEDAGMSVSAMRGTATGVWIGACHFEYRDVVERSVEAGSHLASTGNHSAILANRISYFYNLKGPSLAVDTACSSSLVAVHLAAQAIRQGDCQQAVVGGVNLICSSSNTVSFHNAGILSPTGRCHPFGDGADGYVRGEGAGLVLMKPLARAIADGDQIYGLVCGSAANHGGTASSLTAPCPKAQADVIVQAHRQAGFESDTVGYIEAHGTGTPLGDPIEIAGLAEAYERLAAAQPSQRNEKGWLVGSVKSNIGHLEGAAGIAGMIKVLLAFRSGSLPRSLHAEEPNGEIDFADNLVKVVQATSPWPSHGNRAPRRAGVSSFGFGGAGAHVALEEFITPEKHAVEARPVIISLSARTPEKRVAVVQALFDVLQKMRLCEGHDVSLADIAWTLQRGREPMAERLAFVATSIEDLMEKLQSFLDKSAQLNREDSQPAYPTISDGQKERAVCREIARRTDDYGELSKIAEKWAGGADVDWNRMWQDVRPQVISLPTYPFAGEPYWVTPA